MVELCAHIAKDNNGEMERTGTTQNTSDLDELDGDFSSVHLDLLLEDVGLKEVRSEGLGWNL